jgi:hypothetical protein
MHVLAAGATLVTATRPPPPGIRAAPNHPDRAQPNQFRHSPSSGEGNCVEAGNVGDAVAVRDSKQEGMAHRDVLAFTPAAWENFTLKQS